MLDIQHLLGFGIFGEGGIENRKQSNVFFHQARTQVIP